MTLPIPERTEEEWQVCMADMIASLDACIEAATLIEEHDRAERAALLARLQGMEP